MKIIYKIKLHPLFYLLSFLCIITGLFKDLIIFMIIILLHESGHIMAGLFFKQKVEKIVILPFGGITIFNMLLNTKIYKEFIIAISGPLIQIVFFLIGTIFVNDIRFYNYNLLILIFNLFPIYPLDGSKILNCLFLIFFSFKNSFIVMMLISLTLIFILVVVLLITKVNLLFAIILLFLIIKIIKEICNYKNIYNKFLFERYYYNLQFKKIIYIKSIYNFHKDKRHILKTSQRCMTEKEILRKKFDFKRNI